MNKQKPMPEKDGRYLGRIVLSSAGRDKKRCFMIVSAEEKSALGDIVYIADGKLRKIEKPKKKKLKHLKVTDFVSEEACSLIEKGTLTDSSVNEILEKYRQMWQV